MNRKGFTLIELLAIIVILAVIAVITVPIILNIIDDAEKSSSIDSAHGYKDALQKYYATKSIQNTELELPNGLIMILNLPSNFIVSGESPSDGWIKLKNGSVTDFSLKFGDYVVTKIGDEEVTSVKSDYIVYDIPDEYQRVEYLESSGSQYIDTGTYLLDGEKASIVFSINNIKNYQVIFGQTSTGLGSLQLRQSGGSESQRYYWYNKSSNTLGQLDLNKKSVCSLSLNDNIGEANLNGQTITFNASEDNTNMLIFSRQNTVNYEMDGKVYSFGMGTRRIMVPVIRRSDNKPGMLDLANYSNNLFDSENDAVLSTYINDYSGDQINNATSVSTDYIPVESNTYYYISPISSGNWGAWYNENKEYIDGIRGYGVKQSPNNAKYARFTISHNNSNVDYANTFMIAKSSEALPYEPYRKSFYTNAGTSTDFITGPEI